MSLDPENDAIVRQYVRRVSELSKTKQHLLSQSELESIALEVGIAPETLQEARKTAREHYERGLDYRQRNGWGAAIAELENALVLNPSHADSHFQLALAYDGRYQQTKHKGDRQAALEHLNHCLGLEPNHLEGKRLQQSWQKAAIKSRKSLPVALFVALGSLAALLGSALLIMLQPVKPPSSPDIVESPSSPITNTDTPELPTDFKSANQPVESTNPRDEVDIPLVLTDSLSQAGIGIEVRRSRLNTYPNASFYNLSASLVNDSGQELETVTLLAEWLDDNNQVVAQKSLQILDDQNSILQPGDRFSFATLQETTPDIRQIRLSVPDTNNGRASTTYDAGKVVPIQ